MSPLHAYTSSNSLEDSKPSLVDPELDLFPNSFLSKEVDFLCTQVLHPKLVGKPFKLPTKDEKKI